MISWIKNNRKKVAAGVKLHPWWCRGMIRYDYFKLSFPAGMSRKHFHGSWACNTDKEKLSWFYDTHLLKDESREDIFDISLKYFPEILSRSMQGQWNKDNRLKLQRKRFLSVFNISLKTTKIYGGISCSLSTTVPWIQLLSTITIQSL